MIFKRNNNWRVKLNSEKHINITLGQRKLNWMLKVILGRTPSHYFSYSIGHIVRFSVQCSIRPHFLWGRLRIFIKLKYVHIIIMIFQNKFFWHFFSLQYLVTLLKSWAISVFKRKWPSVGLVVYPQLVIYRLWLNTGHAGLNKPIINDPLSNLRSRLMIHTFRWSIFV